MSTKNILFENLHIYNKYDDIFIYEDYDYDFECIKINDFIKKLKEETLLNDKIEEITFINCSLNAKLFPPKVILEPTCWVVLSLVIKKILLP